jgi:hypothetical protein
MLHSKSPVIRRTEKSISFTKVLQRYMMYSGFFWVLISILFFLLLYNPNYGENSTLYFFSSIKLTTKFIIVLTSFLLFSFLIGTVISIPSIILKILMKIRLDKKSLKGMKPVLLIYAATYFPILCCIFSHITILFINISATPAMGIQWFSEDSFLYRIQKKIYKNIYEIKEEEIYLKWKFLSKKIKKNSKFIFAIPENLISYSNSFKETKNILKFKNDWFFDLHTKDSIAVSLLKEENIPKFYLPAPLSNHKIPSLNKSLNFIGVNSSILLNFSYIFQKNCLQNFIYSSWFSVFLNRIALSQPQIFAFFRIGIPGTLFSEWKWENIVNNNSYLLKLFPQKIITINEEKENFLLFLTEMEEKQKQNLYQFIDFTENMSQKEFKKNLKKIDFYLTSAIRGLLEEGFKNIIVIPYRETSKDILFSKSHSFLKISKPILTPEVIREIFVQRRNASQCHSVVLNYDFLKNNKNLNYNNYFLLDTLDSRKDPYPFIKTDFILSIKNQWNKGFICQNEQNLIYLIIKNDFQKISNSQSIFFKNLYHQVFTSYEKKNRKSENEKNLNHFYEQFDIYRISKEPLQIYKISNYAERNQFLKTFGLEVKAKFYHSISYSLQ